MQATDNDQPVPAAKRGQTARVAIADDSLLVREGLCRLLRDVGFEIVGGVATVDELIALVDSARPDAALVDIRLPANYSDEGLRAAADIRMRAPSVALLVLSQYVEAEYALRLLEGKERSVGYLLKDSILDPAQLTDAITRVLAGGVVVDPTLVAELLDRRRRAGPLDDLTAREREVLALMAEGLTDRGIAQRLYVTEKTVGTHTRHIFQKLSLPESALANKRVHAVLSYLRA